MLGIPRNSGSLCLGRVEQGWPRVESPTPFYASVGEARDKRNTGLK